MDARTLLIILIAICWVGFGSNKLDYLKSKVKTPPPLFARLIVLALWPVWTVFANENEN